MPRVPGPLNPVDDHARNPPWAAVARHDDMNRGAWVGGQAEQCRSRAMAEGGIRARTEQHRPQPCLTAWLPREGRVDPLVQALPATGPQQAVDGIGPYSGRKRLLTPDDPALPAGQVAACIRYRCPHILRVARALLPWRSPFAPLWKTPPGLLRGAFSVNSPENAPRKPGCHRRDAGYGAVADGLVVPVGDGPGTPSRISMRTAMRASAMSGSVTAIRCTRPFCGSATRDTKIAKATALPSARASTGRLRAAQSGSARKRRPSATGAASIAAYATPLTTSCTWLCHDSPVNPGDVSSR